MYSDRPRGLTTLPVQPCLCRLPRRHVQAYIPDDDDDDDDDDDRPPRSLFSEGLECKLQLIVFRRIFTYYKRSEVPG